MTTTKSVDGNAYNEKTFRDRGSGFVIGFYRTTRYKLDTKEINQCLVIYEQRKRK